MWTIKAPFAAVLCNCDYSTGCISMKLIKEARPLTFKSEYIACINPELCIGCGECIKICQFNAIDLKDRLKKAEINLKNCQGCGICRVACKRNAIFLKDRKSLAEVANQRNYCRPEIEDGGEINIKEGRHPMVEAAQPKGSFVPNDVILDNVSQQIIIITGPNMAGKSTVLRQVALIVLMAQMGAPVPASSARIGVVDRIFTRVGATDELTRGRSTFMVEMQETAHILHQATDRSLVILDEIGRGTSTFDGLSIAWAVAEFLHNWQGKGIKTLFATHYHELTDLAATGPRVKNMNVAVKEWGEKIIFLRKLVEGGTNRSYGIQVARLAGLPPVVVERAKQVLQHLEEETTDVEGLPRLVRYGPGAKEEPLQLSLFRQSDQRLRRRLQRLKVEELTPIEALNELASLREMVDEDS